MYTYSLIEYVYIELRQSIAIITFVSRYRARP